VLRDNRAMDRWRFLIVAVGTLLILWVGVVGLLWVAGRRVSDRADWRDSLRLVPDVIRLLRRLIADPTLPRGTRIALGLVLAYLLSPIDLVPDFIPVLGYADDIIVVALTLRAVVHRAGPEVLARHWPGTANGLASVHRLAGLPVPASGLNVDADG
jgi:uncharacterized membrane protein YkvA (DUF1232 family)